MKRFFNTGLALSALFFLTNCGGNDKNTDKPTDPPVTDTAVKKDSGTMIEPVKKDSVVNPPVAGPSFDLKQTGTDAEPKTSVSVNINGKATKIKDIFGKVEVITSADYPSHQIPANAVAACGAWWAGQGSFYYLVPAAKGFELFEGWQDEGVSAKEGYHWKKIKSW